MCTVCNLMQWFSFIKNIIFFSQFILFSAQLPPYCDDAPMDDGVDVHLDLRMQPNEHPLKHHLYPNVHFALATICMAKSSASFVYVCEEGEKENGIKNVKFNFINLCKRNWIFFFLSWFV